MVKLKHTEIHRGGAESAPESMNLESHECSFTTYLNRYVRAFDCEFNIASAGGGTTSLSLRVGLDDLPLILEEIARVMRENALKPEIPLP